MANLFAAQGGEPANAGADQIICSDSTTLEGNAPTGQTGLWKLISGSASFEDASLPNSGVSNLATGENMLVWEFFLDDVLQSSDTILITRVLPPAISAGSDQVVCSDSTQLSATFDSGNGLWTIISGNAFIENPNQSNSNLLFMQAGEISLLWSVSNGICPSENDTVEILVVEPPLVNAGTDTIICGDSIFLSGLVSDGAPQWNIISGNGFIENPVVSQTVLLFGQGETEIVLELTSFLPTCSLSRDTLVLGAIPNPVFSAGNDTAFCSSSFSLNAEITLGSGNWSLVSGSAQIIDPANPQTEIQNAQAGELVFVFTASNGSCQAFTDTLLVNVLNTPLVNAGSDLLICGSSGVLEGSANLANVQWTTILGDAVIESPTSLNSPFELSSGTQSVLVLSAIAPGCPLASDTVLVTSLEQPVISAGIDAQICGLSATLQASLSAGNGQWNILDGVASVVAPNNPESEITVQSPQIVELEWLVTLPGCPQVSDTVIIEFTEPPVISAGQDLSICGNATQLNASNSSGNGQWSLLSGSGTIENPSNPQTSVLGLAQGINELVWTVLAANCPPQSDTIEIFSETPLVAQAGPDQEICSSSANLSAVAVSGGFWELIDGTGVIQSAGSASTTISGLSAGTTRLRWLVPNSVCPASSDTLEILVNEAPAQAFAGSDQNICSTTTTLEANPAGVGAGQWTIVSGNAVFTNAGNPTTSVSALQTGVNVLRWTVSNGNCTPSSDDVIITVDANPETAEAGANQEVCSGSATLGASPANSGTGTWTLVSGAGTIVSPNNPSSQVVSLGVGENVFRWTISGGSCGNVFDDVTITRFALPTVSNAGQDQSICATSASLQANEALTGIGIWSVISGSAQFVDPGDPLTAVSGLAVGENVLQWTITNGICSPQIDQVTITVDLPADAPDAGPDQTICANSTTISAISGSGGAWSLISGAGTIANAGSQSTEVSGLSTGTNVFRWTVQGGSCGSAFDDVTITVNAQPDAANAGQDQEVCGATATLLANQPVIGSGNWSVIAGSGTFADASAALTTVSGLSNGTNTFRWTISNGECTPSADDVTITAQLNAPSANAGSDQSICSSSAQLQATPASGGFWSVVSGTGILSNASLASTTVTGMSAGANIFRWNVPAGSCGNITDDVTLTVQTQPTQANAGADQNICSTLAALQANSPLNGTGVWTIVQGSGIFSNASDPFTEVSGLQAGTNILRWTISNGVCTASTDDVTIIVDSNPVTPLAGADQQICASVASISASPQGGTWSVVTGSAVFADPSSAITSVSGLSVGQNRLRWSVTAGACGTVFDDLIITVSAPPSSASAGIDQQICATFTSLNAIVPLSGTGQWTTIAGNGVFENATSASTVVSGLTPGLNTFRWTVSNGSCAASSDDVNITVQENPLSPDAGPDQSICTSSTQLAATPFPGGVWSLVSGAGNIVNSSSAGTLVTGLAAGLNIFRWTIPGGACNDVSDDVSILVQALPTTANAGPDQQICATVTSLSGNNPLVGNGTWTLVSGSGIIASPGTANTTVSDLATGTNVFRWTITNGVCTPSSDEVSIVVENNPLTPNAGPDQLICATNTQLGASAVPGGAWSLVSGSGTFANASLANTTVTGLGTGVNVFRWTIPGGSCGSASDLVTITVDASPSIAQAGPDQTICISESGVFLQANAAVSGSGIWSVVNGSATFSNASDPQTFVSGLSAGNNVFRWSISNGVCPVSSDEVVIQADPQPVPPNAGADQTICSAGTQLNATAATGALWSVLNGSATITNPSQANSTVSSLSPGTVILLWTIPGGACPDASDQVSITVQAPPSNANAGSDQQLCSTTATLSGNVATSGSGFWTLVSGTGVIADPTSSSTQVSGLSPGNNVFRWTISNGVCSPSSDDVLIAVEDNPVNPDAGPNQTICATSTLLAATAASGGSWSLVSGSGSIANASHANTAVTGLSTGLNVFRWTIAGGSCPDAFDDVQILVQTPPSSANAGSDQTICLSTTQLQANTPSTGAGFWTVVSGSANFSDAQSPSSLVSGLSAGTNTLRWTITNGVCQPSADDVNIFVQETGSVPEAGSDQTICGNTVIMNATPAQGGSWALVSGSGTIANAQLASTAITGLSNGINVFRWTIQNGVCPAVFDEVSITVVSPPSTANAGVDQSICSSSLVLAANTPASGNGQWSVVSGTGFFSNASQANSSVSGLSPGLNVLRWTITNGVCPPSFDEISITVLTAPVAFAGQDQNICGNSSVLEASAAQAGTGNWTVVSGNATFIDAQSPTTAVSGLAPGINVLRWTVVNGTCPIAIDELTIQSFVQPQQPNAGTDQSICDSQTLLSAVVPVVGQGIWSVVSGSGLISSPSQASSTVSNLQAGLNVFRFTVSNGVCPPVSDEVSIEVLSAPVAQVGIDFGVCAASAALNATLAPGSAGQWQLISGSAVIQNLSNPQSLVSNLGVGNNVFLWTVTNGVCPPTSDQITITRFEEPSPANAGTDFQTCATGAQLNAENPLIGSGFWSVVSGSGNFSNPTLPNTSVSQLATGENVLQWTVSNGVCGVQTDQVTITVDQNPTSADAGPDQGICSDETQLAASLPAAGDGFWTVISGTASILNSNQANAVVTGIAPGATTLRWTVSNGTCVSFDEMQIFRSLPPSQAEAGQDRQVCADTVHLNAAQPIVGSGFWQVLSGSASILNPESPNAIVSALGTGANVFVYTISNGNCESTTDQVTIIRQQAPDQANAGSDMQVCDTQISLSANLPAVGTGIWSVISGSATLSNAFDPQSEVSGLMAGENVFRWTTLNGICPATFDDVSVFRAIPPEAVSAGADAQVCGNSASLNAEQVLDGTGTWVLLGGTAQIDDENDPLTGLSNLLPGTITLAWQVSNAPCPVVSDTVQFVVAAQPPQAFAGADISTCSSSTILFGSAPGGGLPAWTLISGNLNIVNPSGQISSINGIEPGMNLIEYSISNAHCVSRDTIQIQRFIPEPLVFAGNDTLICANIFTLSGSEAFFGMGAWTVISGEALIEEPGNEASGLSILSDTLVLEWRVSNGVCPDVSDTVTIVRNTPDEIAQAMNDTIVCGLQFTLNANAAIEANGWWQIVSGDAVIEDTNAAQSFATAQEYGEQVFVWNLNDEGCVSRDTVLVQTLEAPYPVYAGEDQRLCQTTTILDAAVPVLGNGIWSTLAGGFFSDPTDPQSGFITPNAGFRALVWNVSNGNCVVRDTVYIDMIAVPVASGGPDLSGCALDTINLQASLPPFGEGYWVLLSDNSRITDSLSNVSGFVADSSGNYYLRWKVVNDICSDSALVTVSVLDSNDPDCIGNSNDIWVPEGFSPNGDGVFDKLEITHNPNQQIELKIYDRRGILLYQSNNYQNDWDGTSSQGTVLIDGRLPEGTYFYLVRAAGATEYQKGYFTLWR